MFYTELIFHTKDPEKAEILIAVLSQWPFEGFQQEEKIIKAYIPESSYIAIRSEVEAFLQADHCTYTEDRVENVNWNALWESSFEPIVVEKRCLIRAPFHAPDPAFEFDLVIMPKMSFGTGHHTTTYLMAAEIMELPLRGRSGLDMGSGTGVLAILAAKAGSAHVDAIDIDPWAWENCTENISANGLDGRVTPLSGDVSLLAGKHYDFILANINRNILLTDMRAYTDALLSGGSLIVSGILEVDIPTLTTHAESLSLKLCNKRIRDGWAALHFSKTQINRSLNSYVFNTSVRQGVLNKRKSDPSFLMEQKIREVIQIKGWIYRPCDRGIRSGKPSGAPS